MENIKYRQVLCVKLFSFCQEKQKTKLVIIFFSFLCGEIPSSSVTMSFFPMSCWNTSLLTFLITQHLWVLLTAASKSTTPAGGPDSILTLSTRRWHQISQVRAQFHKIASLTFTSGASHKHRLICQNDSENLEKTLTQVYQHIKEYNEAYR